MSKLNKYNDLIMSFIQVLSFQKGLNDKKALKEVKRTFLKLLRAIDSKDEDLSMIEVLIENVESEDFEYLFEVERYFIYKKMSWINPKKWFYHFFELSKIKVS